jgi:TolA-binding protein
MVAIAPHPGPRPEGEPGAIRAYAGEVKSVASGLLNAGDVTIDGWESGAARAAAGRARSATAVVSDVRADLMAAAGELARAADELAEDLKVWKDKLDRHEETVRLDRQEKMRDAQTDALRRLAVGRAG